MRELELQYGLIRKNTGADAPALCTTSNGVVHFAFESLKQTGLVINAFTTRLGGVSKGCFSQMNLCMTRGDDVQDVLENHRIMAEALCYDMNMAVHSHQTHTTNVAVVGPELAGNGVTGPQQLHDIDGMVTNVPGLVLMTFYADCTPLYFLDPVHRAIGLAHSGWKGTRNRIGREVVRRMQKEYGTKPCELLACIGPSICGDCYEVSEDVALEFRNSFTKPERIVTAGIAPGKYQLDLWEANKQVLLDAGILPEHIEVTNVCTKCNPELMFSHRIMGNERGNLAAILGLRPEKL